MKLVQVGNFVLNHKGEVWCMETNECIYTSSYDNALEFIKGFE